jgi:hypothetical protein
MDYTEEEMWEKLPYMKGVKKNRIGVLYTTDENEGENEYKAESLKSAPQKKEKLKKSEERKIRRALRKRRRNGEYIGMPLEHFEELDEDFNCIIISIIVSILALMAGLSFYLV